jgi:hypothetical protein
MLVEVLSRGLPLSLSPSAAEMPLLSLPEVRTMYILSLLSDHESAVFETGFTTTSKYSADIVCCCLTPGGDSFGIYFVLITEYYLPLVYILYCSTWYVPCTLQATEANLRRKGQARGKFAGDAECYVVR